MFAVTSDNGSFCAVEGFHVSVDEAAEAGRSLCRQSAPFFTFLKGSGVHFDSSISPEFTTAFPGDTGYKAGVADPLALARTCLADSDHPLNRVTLQRMQKLDYFAVPLVCL